MTARFYYTYILLLILDLIEHSVKLDINNSCYLYFHRFIYFHPIILKIQILLYFLITFIYKTHLKLRNSNQNH